MSRILLIENDPALCELYEGALTAHGFRCVCAENGVGAAELMSGGEFELAVLDTNTVEYPAELLRYAGIMKTAVIVLSPSADISAKKTAFDAGCDDYLTKPCDTEELFLRCRAVLRRAARSNVYEGAILTYDEITVSIVNRRAIAGDGRIELTPKEFDLLVLLINNRGSVLSREMIRREIWGDDMPGDSRCIDLHAQRLRTKLGLGSRLRAVYRAGYMLT